MSAKPRSRRASRLRSRAPSSSAVDSRTVAKRQSCTSSSPRKTPRCVCVLPTSTTSSTVGGLCSGAMPVTLYAIPASHPCAAVERALQLKGIPYRRVELLPVLHRVVQRLRFGARTVPGLELEDGERLVGSRPIVRKLDARVPEPPLFPPDTETRMRVERAEEWGDQV